MKTRSHDIEQQLKGLKKKERMAAAMFKPIYQQQIREMEQLAAGVANSKQKDDDRKVTLLRSDV